MTYDEAIAKADKFAEDAARRGGEWSKVDAALARYWLERARDIRTHGK